MDNIFTQTWNEAYEIYVGEGLEPLRSYLKEKVAAGVLTRGDAEVLEEDMVETADL